MKNYCIIIGLLFSFSCLAQSSEITKLLSQQFKKEQKLYDKNYDSERPVLTQDFKIVNDTLSYEFTYPTENTEYDGIYYLRSVPLSEIISIEKDYNILFITKANAVMEKKIKRTKNGFVLSEQTSNSHLFFTELRKDKRDQKYPDKMIKAFNKAGFIIHNNHWLQ